MDEGRGRIPCHPLLVYTEPVVMDRRAGFVERMFLILLELYPKYIKWAESPTESIFMPWLNFYGVCSPSQERCNK